MKTTITTEDEMEAKRLIKSLDMANALFEIQYNLFRYFEDDECDHTPVFEKIGEIFEEHGIDVDELVE